MDLVATAKITMNNIPNLNTAAIQALASTLYIEGESVMAESKSMTPVDTGALRASGFVHSPVTSNNDVSVELTYGGSASKYALFVHENLSATHHVGQAKFLEIPVLRNIPKIEKAVRASIAASFLKGK